MAKSPDPWMIGKTRILGLIVRKSSAVARRVLIDGVRSRPGTRFPVRFSLAWLPGKGDASHEKGGRRRSRRGSGRLHSFTERKPRRDLPQELGPVWAGSEIRKKSGPSGGCCRLHPSRGHDQADADPTVAVARATPGHEAYPASGRRERPTPLAAIRLVSPVPSPNLDQPRNARPAPTGKPGARPRVGLSCALLRP